MIALALSLLATPPAATTTSLSLTQAVEHALARSADVEASLLSLEGAALTPGLFDDTFAWTAFAEGGVNRNNAPSTSGFQGERNTTVPLSAGASRLFPTGTWVDVQAAGSWFDSPFPLTIPGVSFIESGWTQSLTVTARHPLYGSRPERQIALQRKELEAGIAASGARVADGMEQTLADVHRRFWAWVLAEEAKRAADEAQHATEELRALVLRKLARGLADERDRLRVEAGVQQAADQVLAAARGVDFARRMLLDRIGSPAPSPSVPEYSLDRSISDIDVDEVVSRAEGSSLALRSLHAAKQTQLASIAVADETLGSRVFAIGRLGEHALFPNGTDAGTGERFPDDAGVVVFGGLRWERNFGEAAVTTRVRQARIELRRIDAETARAQERIRTAAEEQLAALRSARERAAAAAALLATQTSRLAEEERNFAIGRSQLRDVIEARQQLTQARYLRAASLVTLQMVATERDLLAGSLTAPWRESLARRAPAYRRVLPSPAAGGDR